MMSVSVIIPTYNHGRYLPQAIRSVLAQTYANWEMIIVDDGSMDDTATLVAQFSDSRSHYLYQHNQGLSAARNTGVHAAQGCYLAFLDADDEWAPQFLERCVRVLDGDDTLAGVYTRCRFIDQAGNLLPQIGGRVVARADFRRCNLEGGFFPPCAVLVRASVVRQVGLFDTQLTSLEDWDLWIRMAKQHHMQGLHEPLAHYRVFVTSMSTNAERMHANRMAVLAKYLGDPEGDPGSWPEEKRRAFGRGYRDSALTFIQQGKEQQGWVYLRQAVHILPELLGSLDTFYELTCWDQPRGYRGCADALTIEENAGRVLGWLDGLFDSACGSLSDWRGTAYGNAYLSLCILSDQVGRWTEARCYFFRAIKANPDLLAHCSVVRRMLKLCAGQRFVGFGRAVLRGQAAN